MPRPVGMVGSVARGLAGVGRHRVRIARFRQELTGLAQTAEVTDAVARELGTIVARVPAAGVFAQLAPMSQLGAWSLARTVHAGYSAVGVLGWSRALKKGAREAGIVALIGAAVVGAAAGGVWATDKVKRARQRKQALADIRAWELPPAAVAGLVQTLATESAARLSRLVS